VAKAKKSKGISERKIKREVTFKLTTKDKAELGEKFGKLNGLYGEIERQFSGVKKEYTGRLEKIEVETNQIAKWFRDQERREVVEVVEKKDFNKRTVQYFHSGKVVEERDMTQDEMQTELPIEPEKIMVRNPADGEVSEVIKMETHRKSKKTPLDIPSVN